jgi:hypothetical protein
MQNKSHFASVELQLTDVVCCDTVSFHYEAFWSTNAVCGPAVLKLGISV